MLPHILKIFLSDKIMNILFTRTKIITANKKLQMAILLLSFFLYLHLYYYVMIDTEPTFYDSLGVSKQADDAAIRKGFRQLSKHYHPDRNPQYAKLYTDLQEMYNILKEPDYRWMYDRFNIKLEDFRGNRSTNKRRISHVGQIRRFYIRNLFSAYFRFYNGAQ